MNKIKIVIFLRSPLVCLTDPLGLITDPVENARVRELLSHECVQRMLQLIG